jgi:hypothetical protein
MDGNDCRGAEEHGSPDRSGFRKAQQGERGKGKNGEVRKLGKGEKEEDGPVPIDRDLRFAPIGRDTPLNPEKIDSQERS